MPTCCWRSKLALSARVRAAAGRAGPVRMERADRVRQAPGIPWRRDGAAVVRLRQHRDLTGRLDCRHIRPSGGEDAVQLARHDVARQPRLQRDNEQVGGRERVREAALRLKRQERDVRHAEIPHLPLQLVLLDALALKHDLQVGHIAEQRGRFDDRLETLREAQVARVHHDELAVETVRRRERVAARARRDGGRVRPVRNDGGAIRGGALVLDQPAPHRLAERDVHRRPLDQKTIHPLQARVDRGAVEVRQERGDFREEVLERHHERRAEPPPRQVGRQADDRRIGQRDDDVRPVDPQARDARGQEVADVVARARRKPALVEVRAAGPVDLDAVPLLAPDD